MQVQGGLGDRRRVRKGVCVFACSQVRTRNVASIAGALQARLSMPHQNGCDAR